MKRTLKNKDFMAIAMNLAALFLFVFVFGACSDEHFIPEDREPQPGNPTVDLSEFKFHDVDELTQKETSATYPSFYEGFVAERLGEETSKLIEISAEEGSAPQEISWEAIPEVQSSSAEKMYLGYTAGEAKKGDSSDRKEVSFTKYNRECTLHFLGRDVVLNASWLQASYKNSEAEYCRYDSTTVATQKSEKLEEIEIEGKKFNRMQVTAKAENHFTLMPSKKPVKKPMDITYTTLVPVEVVPGDKIYEGSTSVEGTGKYTKVSETEYKSQIDLTHFFTQDGQSIKEQETVSGIATVKTWVEEQGPKMVVPTIEIGNPTVSVKEDVPTDLYQKDGYIYAKMYKTTWTYTWQNGFTKRVYSEVERLYYMREVGKEVAMPFGETSTAFDVFNAGNAVTKEENGKKYDAYPQGKINFSGNHKSVTGNVNDAITGLEVGQEFWVAKEDKFLGFDKEIIEGNNSKDAQIIITEHWELAGDKQIVFTQKANYTFSVSEQQRVFGENLNFVSGPAKSSNAGEFNETSEGQFVRTVTDTYTAKFNLCEVKSIAGFNEAYIEYRSEKIYFKFAPATVEYKGLNNPTATEVEVDGKLYSRLAYEVSFSHNLLGNKKAIVLVDKEIPFDPTTPPEWGEIDIEKTKKYGGISVSWETRGNKLYPITTGTVFTTKGIISFKQGYDTFTEMNTNTVTERVGNVWDGTKLTPAYIKVMGDAANPYWKYTDLNGQLLSEVSSSKLVEAGVKKDQPFLATGGEANVYQITSGDGYVRIVIMFEGKLMFEEVFPASK